MATKQDILDAYIAQAQNAVPVETLAPQKDLTAKYIEDPLKAAGLGFREQLGKDIKGVGNIVQKFHEKASDYEGPEKYSNVLQRLGTSISDLNPEQKKLMEENVVGKTVGNIGGMAPGFVASSFLTGGLAPALKGVKGIQALAKVAPKLTSAGIAGVKTGAEQLTYDALTDKGFNPENIALAGVAGGLFEGVPAGIKALRKSSPQKNINKVEKVLKQTLDDVPDTDKTTVSKALGGSLSDETVENIAQNPTVRSYVAKNPYIEQNVPELAKDAKDAVFTTIKDLKKAGQNIYTKAGITDETLVTLKPEQLTNLDNGLQQFTRFASTSDAPIIKSGQEVIENIMSKMEKGKLPFGLLKRETARLEELASKAYKAGDKTAGSFYAGLKNTLKEARDTIPELGTASKEFSSLKQAENLIKNVLRLNSVAGEKGAEKAILRLTTELGNKTNKEMLETASALLKQNPETAHLAGFLDKIKLAQAAHDITKAKAITPQGWGRLPVIKHLMNVAPISNPQTRAQVLAQLSERGIINPQAISREIKTSKLPFIGKTITGLRARKELYQMPSLKGAVEKQTPFSKYFQKSDNPKVNKNIEYVENNLPKAKHDYFKRVEKEYGSPNVITADEGKYVIPGYKAELAPEYHEAASGLSKIIYDEKLLQNKGKGNNTVLFMSGGTGSGKTTAMRDIGTNYSDYPLIYDTNLTGLDSSVNKVNKALENGYKVQVAYVQRDPIVAFREGVIPRVKTKGRIVPVKEHLFRHKDAFENLQKLKQKFGDQLDVRYIDNTGPKGTAKSVPLENLPKFDYNTDKLGGELNDIIKQAELRSPSEPGYITKQQADAIRGTSDGLRPADSEILKRKLSQGTLGIPGKLNVPNAAFQSTVHLGTNSITDLVRGMRQNQQNQRQENRQNSNIPMRSVG